MKNVFRLKRLFSLENNGVDREFSQRRVHRPFLIYFMVLITTLRLLAVTVML